MKKSFTNKRIAMIVTVCLMLMLFTGAGLQAKEISMFDLNLFNENATEAPVSDLFAVVLNAEETALPITATLNDEAKTAIDVVQDGTVTCGWANGAAIPKVVLKVPVFNDQIVLNFEQSMTLCNSHNDWMGTTATSFTLNINEMQSDYYCAHDSGWSTFYHIYVEYYAPADAEIFDVNVAETEHGTVTAEPVKSAAGLKVALTVTPDGGYTLGSLSVTDGEGNPVSVSGSNVFAMPASDVTVSATFVEIPTIKYTVGSATAAPGETVYIPVTVDSAYDKKAIYAGVVLVTDDAAAISMGEPTQGKDVSSDEFYVRYDPVYGSTSTFTGNGKIGYNCTNGWDGYPVPSGEFAVVPVTVDKNASFGTYEIKVSSAYLEFNSLDSSVTGPYRQEFVAGTVTVEIEGANPTELNAPVLTSENVNAKNTLISIEGVDASLEAEDAAIQYRYSANEGETWSAWQDDTILSGLKANTAYQIQARYVTPDNKTWKNSPASEAITATTAEGTAIEYVVGNVKGIPGKSVWVPVIISNNCPTGWNDGFTCNRIALDYSADGLTIPEASFHGYNWPVYTAEDPTILLGNPPDGTSPFWYPQTDSSAPKGWSLAYSYSSGAVPSCHLVSIRVDIPKDADLKTYEFKIEKAEHDWEMNWSTGGYATEGVDYNVNCINGSIEVVDNSEFPVLDAPEITEAEAGEDYITVTPPVSEQDPDAEIEYSYSADNGATWFDWQESNVFYPVNPETNYCVRARYVTSDPLTWNDSANSKIFRVKTLEKFDPEMTLTYNEQKTVAVKRGETVEIPVVIDHNFEGHDVSSAYIGSWVNEGGEEANVNLVDATFNSAVEEKTGWTDVQNYDGQTYEFYCIFDNFEDNVLPEGEYMTIIAEVGANAETGSYKVGVDLSQEDNFSAVTHLQYKHPYGGWLNYEDVNYINNYCTVVVMEPLVAPVLTEAVADDTSITVTAPVSAQDENAAVEYAISTDGEEWSDWQDSNVFSGLEAETEYQIRARYISTAESNYDNSYAGDALKVSTVNPVANYILGSAEAKPGETVVVPISVDHNIVKQNTSFSMVVTADDALTLESVAAGSALTGEGWKVIRTESTVQIYKEGNVAFDVPKGEVALLTFTVGEAVSAGEYAVSLTKTFGEDGNSFTAGEELLNVNGTVTAGKVTVIDLNAIAADEVEAMISAIGEVTLESKEVIEAARAAYDALTEEQRALVENADDLIAAEEALAALEKAAADAADQAAADEVETIIDAIGEISLDSKEAIEAARAAYDALTDTQKALVENLDVLTAAEAAYAELTKPVDPIEFTDVNEDDWFYGAVQYVAQKGLMEGMGNNKFSPDTDTTRGQLVTILYRMEGEPSVAGLANPFTDLTQDWYKNAVIWAADEGIVKGMTETTYAPEIAITREQAATILYRYAEFKGYDTASVADISSFVDSASVSDYAKTAMSWAVSKGLINGSAVNGQTLLDPQGTAIRAQLAALLQRFCENIAE